MPVDHESPPAERTSKKLATGFGGPAAPPAVEGSSDATARVGWRSSTRASTIRTFAAFTDTRVGKGPSKHSGNGRPPPTEVTMYDSPYDSEEEVDACIAQEVAIEHEDFVDEILEESPETIQTTSDTSLAISRDSDAISGGGSNANSGGGSSTVDSQQANSRDSDANSGGRSSGSDTRHAIGRDPNASSGGDSNANSGGGSSAVDTQQAISRDPNARGLQCEQRRRDGQD